MVKRLAVLLFAVFGLVSPAYAAQVQLVVPYRTLEIGQQGQAEVVIVNGNPSAIPSLPHDPGLDVRYLSQTRGSRTVNFVSTRIVALTYSVRALQEGTYTLGPVEVEVDGQTMQTNAVTITVEPRPAGLDDQLVAYAKASEDEAWEGQVVLYQYGLRSRLRILRSSWLALPVTRLARPREGAPVRRQYAIDDPAGPIWVDETWEPFLVTSGDDVTLEPAVVQVEVPAPDPRGRMRLFQPTEARTAATDPVTLKVRRLPPPPPGFTGLVGDFTVEGRVDQTSAAVGESVEWNIAISGDGTLEGFQIPVPADRDEVRFYDGTPIVQAQVTDEGFRSDGRFTRVIVPTRAGRLQVPPLDLVTFSPTRGAYVTHTLEVPPIEVAPGREGEGEMESFAPDGTPTERPQPTVVDFYPVREAGPATVPFAAPWILALAALLALVATVPLGLDLWAVWRARRPAVVDATPAIPPGKRLERLPDAPADRLTVLDDALRDALSFRVGVPAARLDRREAVNTLPEPLAEEVDHVVRAIERARFGGEAPPEDLPDRVRAVVRALEEAA